MKDVFIVSAQRTPIGKFGGAFRDVSPVDLGAHAMRATLDQADVDGSALDIYIMGNVLRSGHGQLLPRQAALRAGIPQDVDGYAIDMVCSSAMMAAMNGATMIRAGEADLVLVGGMESMSQTGFGMSAQSRWGMKYLNTPAPFYDILKVDGLTDPTNDMGMGDETERVSSEHDFSREELDQVACDSHKRAFQATESGVFAKEITPFEVKTRKGAVLVEADEGIRADTTVETLGKLRPAFSKEGVLTAGNSSQLSDGAAGMVLASAGAVTAHGLKPLAKLVGGRWAAVEPYRFIEAPVLATQRLLERHKLAVSDVDLFENNEAFAASSVLFKRQLGVGYDRLNVHGGAIALGHPIGCTGARMMVTLVNALDTKNAAMGVAAMCHGVGGGTAVLVERI